MQYIALLRGINVGGKNKLDMKKLKTTFEKLGFQQVRTYINSGNILFHTERTNTDEIAAHIKRWIQNDFKLKIPVLIKSAPDIIKVSKAIPSTWTNSSEQKSDVLFLWDHYDSKKTLELIAKDTDVETLRYVPGAILWNVDRNNYSKSGMNSFAGSEVYAHMTARNVNTVRKLAALMK
jgi:uncharacterized protein (DUF1697 family)